MPLPVTALYAGLLGLLAIVLGAGSGFIRNRTGVSLGEGGAGNPEQLLAFRRHGNFAEWVPLALILIAIVELNGAPTAAVHALGAALVVVRVAHPLGLHPERTDLPLRTVGAAGTALIVLISAVWAITTAF